MWNRESIGTGALLAPLNFSYPTCLAIATEEIAVAHQIFRSSCSITPLAVPGRCRSASRRQKGVERIGCWACAAQVHQKTQSKGKIGRAEMALTLINKLYGIERDMEEAGDAQRYQTRASRKAGLSGATESWAGQNPLPVTSSKCLGQAINCLASNWLKRSATSKGGHLPIDNNPTRAGEPPSHVHMTKASPVSSRYVMPTHDGY
ncbi:IS66 family transposase [Escherichia coli]|uniref:IS66 family transposase n=1 Tax=Escherichia coli TaxID=562 RepID=UPI0032EBB0A1